MTDAYFVAQTIPEFLFSLIVQALYVGFIPIYTEIITQRNKEEAMNFVYNLLSICILLSFILVISIYSFPRTIISIFANGFTNDAFSLAMDFVKLSVWGLSFRITVTIISLFLQANNKFFFFIRNPT